MRALSDLFRNFMQLGYVTDDIDAAASYLEVEARDGGLRPALQVVAGRWSAPVGAGAGAGAGEPRAPFVVVDGEPAAEWVIDVALVNAGPTNLEIIRPVGGAVDLYRGAIRPGVPATLHHLGFRVDDFEEASAVVAASGRTWKQYGDSGGIRFGYLDMTAELGHFVEVMELDEASAQGFAHLEAASNAVRDGEASS